VQHNIAAAGPVMTVVVLLQEGCFTTSSTKKWLILAHTAAAL